jgi:glycerol uptake facilitator-like aquaporin
MDARRLAAEALGTLLLVAAVVGSGIMAERLAGGNAALALLANTAATGAALVVLVLMFQPVSGAAFNPAVTLALWSLGRIGARQAALDALAQIAGGVLGTVVAHAMFGRAPLEIGTTPRAGAGLWLAEAVATFGLVGAILLVERAGRAALAAAVGLYIAAAYWFTASTSFANPAVTLARGFTESFAGIRLADVPAFALVQFAAAIPAARFFRWLAAGPASR